MHVAECNYKESTRQQKLFLLRDVQILHHYSIVTGVGQELMCSPIFQMKMETGGGLNNSPRSHRL